MRAYLSDRFSSRCKKTTFQEQNPHRKKMARTKGKAPSAWDIAKPLLEKDYLEGVVTDDMLPRDVIQLREEYKAVKIQNFRSNWNAMKKRIAAHKERANVDESIYLHDVSIYKLSRDKDHLWHGSEAERLLKIDVKRQRHEQLHPSFLYLSRPEYQKFDYQVFRKHIHQEARSARETPYWTYKKAKRVEMLL
eukprot:scaffold7476_cov68-Cylindrotheca_fusiformis.AAC.3